VVDKDGEQLQHDLCGYGSISCLESVLQYCVVSFAAQKQKKAMAMREKVNLSDQGVYIHRKSERNTVLVPPLTCDASYK